MSTSFYACTFPIDASLLGDEAALRADAMHRVEAGMGLETDSRDNWYLWTLGRMEIGRAHV